MDKIKIIAASHANTRELIKRSRLVVTINSTVGIESLLYYKPVITLGNAFYNIEGLTFPCQNIKELDLLIEKSINKKINKNLIDKFLFYLKFMYGGRELTDEEVDGKLASIVEALRDELGASLRS